MRAFRVLVLVLLGCVASKPNEPSPIMWDRDTCAGCGMVISDHLFAAEVRAPTGTLWKFDDVGCAAKWLAKQPFANDATTMVWVTRHSDGAWLDAKAARFVAGQASPMAFNYAAGNAPEGIDFAALSRAVTAPKGATR